MDYKIENDVPLKSRTAPGKWAKIATQMNYGDSIFMPDLVSARMLAQALRMKCRRIKYGKLAREKGQVTIGVAPIRKVEGGYRVWFMYEDTEKIAD